MGQDPRRPLGRREGGEASAKAYRSAYPLGHIKRRGFLKDTASHMPERWSQSRWVARWF
ncbi:MAG TPA: hypothetical protein V6C71_04830 [Coleofasciculaceae cyanobacterium]